MTVIETENISRYEKVENCTKSKSIYHLQILAYAYSKQDSNHRNHTHLEQANTTHYLQVIFAADKP